MNAGRPREGSRAGRTGALVAFCVLTLLVPFALLAADACTCGLGLECACPHHGARHPGARATEASAAADCHPGAAAPEPAAESCRLRPSPPSDRSTGSHPGRLAALFDLSSWLSLSGARPAPPELADLGPATAPEAARRLRDPSRPTTPPPRPFGLV
jgi:hypothetical protein